MGNFPVNHLALLQSFYIHIHTNITMHPTVSNRGNQNLMRSPTPWKNQCGCGGTSPSCNPHKCLSDANGKQFNTNTILDCPLWARATKKLINLGSPHTGYMMPPTPHGLGFSHLGDHQSNQTSTTSSEARFLISHPRCTPTKDANLHSQLHLPTPPFPRHHCWTVRPASPAV